MLRWFIETLVDICIRYCVINMSKYQNKESRKLIWLQNIDLTHHLWIDISFRVLFDYFVTLNPSFTFELSSSIKKLHEFYFLLKIGISFDEYFSDFMKFFNEYSLIFIITNKNLFKNNSFILLVCEKLNFYLLSRKNYRNFERIPIKN